MLLITQNAENLFTTELRNCLQQKASTRCIILKLSLIPQKPEDWPSRTTETIERCLGSDGQIFFHETGDVTVLVHNATRKDFSRLVALISTRLSIRSLQRLAYLYELPVDGGILKNLFTAQKEARTKPANIPANIIAKTERLTVAKDYLNQTLVSTIALRREKRTAPEILLVEDDDFFQRLVGSLLNKRFRVTMAQSGADALDRYIQSAPDMVFLNIGLPDISGYEVLDSILELDPNACIVILSGQGSRDNVLRAKALGAAGFVGKPFTVENLFSSIDRCHFIQEKLMKVVSGVSTFPIHRLGAGQGNNLRASL